MSSSIQGKIIDPARTIMSGKVRDFLDPIGSIATGRSPGDVLKMQLDPLNLRSKLMPSNGASPQALVSGPKTAPITQQAAAIVRRRIRGQPMQTALSDQETLG